MNVFEFQLYEANTNRALAIGGNFCVCAAGSTLRAATYDESDTLQSGNAQSISSGRIRFRTQESLGNVDIYGVTEYGYSFTLKNVKPGSRNQIFIDLQNLNQTIVLPLHYTDLGAAAAEYSTGFYLTKDVPVLPQGSGIYVSAIDATETLDVGTDSTSGANDPNGFFAAISVGVLGFTNHQIGYTVGTNSVWVDLTGGTEEWTTGELFHPATTKSSKAEGTDSATTKNGFAQFKPHVPSVGGSTAAYKEQITVTPSSGLDTFTGLLVLRQQLPFVPNI